jgi:hypothetical protein
MELTTVKMAILAPMPVISANSAKTVKGLLLRYTRSAYRTSCQMLRIR